jgi:hypothetical protein
MEAYPPIDRKASPATRGPGAGESTGDQEAGP